MSLVLITAQTSEQWKQERRCYDETTLMTRATLWMIRPVLRQVVLEEVHRVAREEAAAMLERCAADHGLSPRHALGSVGDAILWSSPSMLQHYAEGAACMDSLKCAEVSVHVTHDTIKHTSHALRTALHWSLC